MQLETFRLQFINTVSLYGEITEMHDKKVSNFDFPIKSGDSPIASRHPLPTDFRIPNSNANQINFFYRLHKLWSITYGITKNDF